MALILSPGQSFSLLSMETGLKLFHTGRFFPNGYRPHQGHPGLSAVSYDFNQPQDLQDLELPAGHNLAP